MGIITNRSVIARVIIKSNSQIFVAVLRFIQGKYEINIYTIRVEYPFMINSILVAPHGDEILVPESEPMIALREAMIKARDIVGNAETYIVVSPHNVRIDTHIGIILTEYMEGSWRYKKLRFRRKFKNDRNLAKRIYETANTQGIPVVGINFGALEGPLSKMSLDWGTLIPLYFLPRRNIVLITPARGISRHSLVRFGEIMGKIADEEKRKISVIISADHAHTHSPDGPYGFSEMAEEYDSTVVRSLKSGKLEKLLDMPQEVIDSALPDSYWQLLMLYGIMKIKHLKPEFVVYGMADYFGMAVSLFR